MTRVSPSSSHFRYTHRRTRVYRCVENVSGAAPTPRHDPSCPAPPLPSPRVSLSVRSLTLIETAGESYRTRESVASVDTLLNPSVLLPGRDRQAINAINKAAIAIREVFVGRGASRQDPTRIDEHPPRIGRSPRPPGSERGRDFFAPDAHHHGPARDLLGL